MWWRMAHRREQQLPLVTTNTVQLTTSGGVCHCNSFTTELKAQNADA